MMPNCPLCGGTELHLAAEIDSKDIVTIYRRLFAIETSCCFNDVVTVAYYRCHNCGLLFYHPTIMGDQTFYDKLQEADWYYSADKSEFEFARKYIRPDDRVLEVGCGRGLFARQVPGRYVGLELNEKATANASADGHTVYVRTIEDHAQTCSGEYDVVCSFQVLEHVVNPDSYIASCVACLKEGGLLILSVPSEDSYLALVEDGILNMPPHHLTRWPDATLMWLADRYSLELVTLRHEQLADIHVHGYATETIRSWIKKLFRVAPVMIATTVRHRALTFICQIAGVIYAKMLTNREVRPAGDSVTIVLKKVPHT